MKNREKKVKILLLGYNDSPLRGNVLYNYNVIPSEKFDKRMVVYTSLGDKKHYAFHHSDRSMLQNICRKLDFRPSNVKAKIAYRIVELANKKKPEYCFYDVDKRCDVTAQDILDKNPDFIPDVIALYWTASFINSKIVRDLHDLTGAIILFVFVDEAHLTGGCHYPNDCDGYLCGCHDCPALSFGKKVAEIQMSDKLKYWADMPKIVYGVKSDCILAKASPVFKDAFAIAKVSTPEVKITDRHIARNKWGISDNDFVILLGANLISDIRKGIKYAIEAINMLATKQKELCVLLLGSQDGIIIEKLGISKNVKVIAPGFLSLDDLFQAFCASDCHISPSIADSGPMMVNYSIACGTPVVSFNIGVARDIVLHKETGYIAEYKDSYDIAVGLEWLYNQSEESRNRIRQNCLDLMEGLKKQQRAVYNDVYDYVIKRKSSIKGNNK